MTSPAVARYQFAWTLLADLADWLRRQRIGQYERLVAKRHLSPAEAEQDRRARSAIAADWRAISLGMPVRYVMTATPAERWWSLEKALDGVDQRILKLASDDAQRNDWRDLRDAVECLLWLETTGTVERILEVQFRARGRRAAA